MSKPAWVGGAAAAALVLSMSWWATPSSGRDGAEAKAKADDKNKRIVYVVKHGTAKDLAAVLSKHFKGEVEVQALPESSSNCLLINTPAAAFDEVVKLLEQIDRKPRTIAVEVTVVEVTPKKGDDGKDLEAISGTPEDVQAKIDDLRKKGLVGGSRRFQLTTLENQPAAALVGESRPYVVGITVTGTGVTARRINYRNVGTRVKLTARAADKQVMVDLDLEDARSYVPEDGIELGKDEKGVPVRATEFATANLNAKLGVPDGKTIAAKGVKTVSKTGVQTLVLVSARVVADK
jgi:type II secretory pathway component GspD/PulD (secretin)